MEEFVPEWDSDDNSMFDEDFEVDEVEDDENDEDYEDEDDGFDL